MFTEDYVSFDTAKLLKDKGFREWCSKCYGVVVLHNGADISFDEECDLKDEGRENEIEYVEGGRLYDYGYNNHDKDAKVWAAPTLWTAMKWLREVHNISIEPLVDFGNDNEHWWTADIAYIKKDGFIEELSGYNSYEEVCEAAVKYCLENLISIK